MGKKVYYDKEADVIVADFSGLTVNNEILEEIVTDTVAIAKTLNHKVFAVSCWHETKMGPEMAERFGQNCVELLKHLRGLVRYGVADPVTNITIRSTTLMTHLQGNNSYIYQTKEEALAAVRQREKLET